MSQLMKKMSYQLKTLENSDLSLFFTSQLPEFLTPYKQCIQGWIGAELAYLRLQCKF